MQQWWLLCTPRPRLFSVLLLVVKCNWKVPCGQLNKLLFILVLKESVAACKQSRFLSHKASSRPYAIKDCTTSQLKFVHVSIIIKVGAVLRNLLELFLMKPRYLNRQKLSFSKNNRSITTENGRLMKLRCQGNCKLYMELVFVPRIYQEIRQQL